MRGGYGKPTPRIGHRDASGLVGRITSISRTLYPYQQTEDQGSDGHYGVRNSGSFNASHNHSASYSAESPMLQQYSYYSQRSYTETRGSFHSDKGSVQSVRESYRFILNPKSTCIIPIID